ncbi:MAG: DUF523 domain-containing protein [Desulfuromonadales bacterium]|nr:DUF523 domain-containing protein [Desulfuromonadales bacterium]
MSDDSEKTILVSACLLGLNTRYDGKTKRSQAVIDYLERHGLTPIPVCPEQLAGMPTPRPKTSFAKGDGAAVLAGSGSVISASGQLMNQVFIQGAEQSLQVAQLSGCNRALFKERSPSCGVKEIYLGDEKVPGCGVATALLQQAGLNVISEEDASVSP